VGGSYTSAAMPIDIDIAHVARLARLGLGEEELETYKAQLGVILEHAARVQSLEVEPDVEAAHPLDLANAFRDDLLRPSLDRDEVLAQAPETIDGYFAAPPALETE
jgi:aspartyl-tRNA(Asn)/glutamyl-tRNA(Gln) amidotransferase subunit C